MFITIANKIINCYYLSTFFFKDNTGDNVTTYQIIYVLVNGRKYIEEFSNEEDRLARYNKVVADLTACGMFILINTVPQNVVQIASLDKEDTIIDDTPVYKVIYRIQNGDNLEESFNSSSDRNTRFDEVSSIRIGSLGGLKVEVVDELPPIEEAETGILYLVPKEGSGNDVYDEYIVVEIDDQRSYEFLGTTAVDLSDYYTKEETDTLLGNKQDTLVSGTSIKTINGGSILGAGDMSLLDVYYINLNSIGDTEKIELQKIVDKIPSVGLNDVTNKIVVYNTANKVNNTYQSFYFITSNITTTFTLSSIPYVNDRGLGYYRDSNEITRTLSIIEINKTSLTGWLSTTHTSLFNIIQPYYNYDNAYMPQYDGSPATKKYVDNNVAKYTIMPTASLDNLNRIVQYIGTTDSSYTQGYFYKCVSDGESTPTYSWTPIKTQAGDSIYVLSGTITTSGPNYILNIDTEANRQVLKDIFDNYDNIDKSKVLLYIPEQWTSGTATNTYYTPVFFGKGSNNSFLHLLFIHDTILGGGTTNYYGNRVVKKYELCVRVSFSSGEITTITSNVDKVYSFYDNNNYVLGLSNTKRYTPSGDYNPATKKYVDDKVSTSLTNIAPTYSSSSTYSVGDYVIYSGNLYVCNTDISMAEDWTSAHWTQTTVAEILGNINTLLGGI